MLEKYVENNHLTTKYEYILKVYETKYKRSLNQNNDDRSFLLF